MLKPPNTPFDKRGIHSLVYTLPVLAAIAALLEKSGGLSSSISLPPIAHTIYPTPALESQAQNHPWQPEHPGPPAGLGGPTQAGLCVSCPVQLLKLRGRARPNHKPVHPGPIHCLAPELQAHLPFARNNPPHLLLPPSEFSADPPLGNLL